MFSEFRESGFACLCHRLVSLVSRLRWVFARDLSSNLARNLSLLLFNGIACLRRIDPSNSASSPWLNSVIPRARNELETRMDRKIKPLTNANGPPRAAAGRKGQPAGTYWTE